MTEAEIKSELGIWFIGWWTKLPTHYFTSESKGSRQECWNEVKKLKPDKELRDKIDWFTRERTYRYAKLKATHKLPGWKHAVRLIRHKFWEDDLPGSADEDTKRAGGACSCGKPVGHTNQCWECYDKDHKPPFIEELRAACRQNNIKPAEGQSVADAHREWWRQKRGLGGVTEKLKRSEVHN